MTAQYDPNERVPPGTVIFPEMEALRYLIAEQKDEIKRLVAENEKLNAIISVLESETPEPRTKPISSCTIIG